MSDTVIKVENLGKRYRLGQYEKEDTFAGQLKNTLLYPIRNFRRIANLNRFKEGVDDPSIFWALQDINFEVKKGEVLGIIGHNGAGKSTLLKLLSKITEPTTGRIELKGRVSALLEVGTGFHPELTGRDNVYMNGTILGMTKKEIDIKFEEIVEFAGVAKHIDTPVKFYSSGMKVRLGFSVAAHLEPEILIIDEVLAVGDFEFQKKCLGKMDDVAHSGRTVLFVSHNMGSVKALCNNCILLKAGKVEYYNTTSAVVAKYLSLNEELQQTPLGQRKDRKGNQKVIINYIRFLHGIHKTQMNVLVSGTPTIIEFNYSCAFPEDIKNLRIAIAFSHPNGDERFVCDNYYTGQKLLVKKREGKILCYIKKWPLNSGEYYYRIHVEDSGELYDRVINAGKVKVEYGDFFKTGFKVPPHLNGVFVDHIWS